MRKMILIAPLLAPVAAQAGYLWTPQMPSAAEMRQRNIERQVEENNDILRRQELRERQRQSDCEAGYTSNCR